MLMILELYFLSLSPGNCLSSSNEESEMKAIEVRTAGPQSM